MSFSKSNNYIESFYFLYFGRYLLVKVYRIMWQIDYFQWIQSLLMLQNDVEDSFVYQIIRSVDIAYSLQIISHFFEPTCCQFVIS